MTLEKFLNENALFLEHDETMTKWRWHAVKQVGERPSPRTGMSVAVTQNLQKCFIFGGVQDVKDEDEDLEGKFFNDVYTVNVENEKATWHLGRDLFSQKIRLKMPNRFRIQ